MNKTAAVTELYGELKAARNNDGPQEFLPQDVLDRIVTAERLKIALRSGLTFGIPKLAENVARHAQKVCAILILIEELAAIKSLWKQGLRDEHLPLSEGTGPQNLGKLIAADGKAFSTQKTGLFVDYQWLVLAPIIEDTGQNLILNAKCPMPFVYSDDIGGGAFSVVHKCEIHQAHQKGLQVENGQTYVAVKEFQHKGKGNPEPFEKEAYEKEKKNLETLRSLDHPHIIRHHATYETDRKFHVIFPWADGGNLETYWQNSGRQARTSDLAVWCLRQMLGLAEALAAMHRARCRHGDLKPENILRFNVATDPILVIGDVGVSRIHRKDTFLRTEKTTTKATTPSYQAPEAHMGSQEKRSRVYDSWSLGCIFLEFTTWLLFDFAAVVAFQYARVAPDNFSYFYKPAGDESIVVHPEVTRKINSLLLDRRCQPGTPLGDLVTLISSRLLQVEVQQRATADEVVAKLREIVSNAEASKSSLLETTEGIVAEAEIDHLQKNRPPDRGHKDSVMEVTTQTTSSGDVT